MKPTEKDICRAFYNQLRIMQAYDQINPDIVVFHVTNEQYNNMLYTKSLKQIGLTAGVADYCILLPQGRVAFIEFKRDAKKRLEKTQRWFKERCENLGIPYSLQWTVEGAIEFIQKL